MTPAAQTTMLLLCAMALAPVPLVAQVPLPDATPGDPAQRFEVAAVKPYIGTEPARFRIQPSGRLDVTGASVRLLLQNAFRVRSEHVIGLPEWADQARYSIATTAPAGANATRVPIMLANLLSDRFGLVVHRETREMQTFNLVLARDDGRLGPRLRPTSDQCRAMISAGAPAAAPPDAGSAQAPCGATQAAAGIARASGVPLPRLAQMLTQLTGRRVNDMTGLSGLFDFTLTFNPNLNVDAPGNSDAPHLFTALQEQLGFRLASQDGPVDVVIVDRIERPTVD